MKKVLIVDDNVSFTEFLDATIRAAGHETCVVHNGNDALQAYQQQRPDLVFLDVLLPKMDGFKVCQQIRTADNGTSTPIVMMTGIYTKRNYQRDALTTYGASDYLVKPFAITEIWQVLERRLGQARGGAGPASAQEAPGDLINEDARVSLGGVSLRDRPLALVLSELHKDRRTGLLFLKGEPNTDVFFLEKGDLVFVRSNDVSQRLDKILVGSGAVTGGQIEEARALMVESRGQSRMGEILVSLGYLDSEHLQATVQAQLRQRIHLAFQNEDLGFTFVEGPLPEEEDIRVHLDMANLILEGTRSMPPTDTFRRHLPDKAHVLARGSMDPAEIHFTAYEQQILGLANGQTTVGQALALGRLAEIDAERTLFALLCIGAVTAQESAEPRDEQVSSPAADDRKKKRRPFLLPPQGDLRILPPSRVLAALHAAGQTGVLELRGPKGTRWLYVDRGKVVFARSDDPGDRLGEVLVEGGLITVEQRKTVSRMLEEAPEKRMGQILMEQKLLGLQELQWAVVYQVQRIISSTLGWNEGRYSYREGDLPTEETITVELPTMDLLLEGLRRIPPGTAVRYLPSPDTQLVLASDSEAVLKNLRLTAQERDVLRALSKPTTGTVLRRRRIVTDEVLAVTLHMLLAMDFLEASKEAPADEPRKAAPQANLLEDLASEAESLVATPSQSPDSKGQDPPGADEKQKVPRFLYDQILKERRGLEAHLYEKRERIAGAQRVTQSIQEIVTTFRENVRQRGESVDLERLDPILEEVLDLCGRSLEELGPPENSDADESK